MIPNDPLLTTYSPRNEQQSPAPVLYPLSLAQSPQSAGLSTATSRRGTSVSSNSVEGDNSPCNLHQPTGFFAGTQHREPIQNSVDPRVISASRNYSKILPAPARTESSNGNKNHLSRPRIHSYSSNTLHPGNKRQVPRKVSVRRRRRQYQQITCLSCSKVFSRPCDLK
jgi:hypothetical protein